MSKTTYISPDELHFDPKNPRMVEFGLTEGSTETEYIELLWKTMDIQELVMSISASGFLPHEPLIVAEEGGKKIVIEGNRRLAAVKIIRNREQAESLNIKVGEIPQNSVDTTDELPCVIDTREHSWRYLGFKHVNGPAKWGSYAKAKYIDQVANEYGVALGDIAKQIGDTHKTAQKLYQGYRVLMQAVENKLWSLEDRVKDHFAFSHLYTALGYPSFREFISLKPEQEEDQNPVPEEQHENLQQIMHWLYGSRGQQIEPVVKTQNPDLGKLEKVLKSRDAVMALKAGETLESAVEISRPDYVIFEEALLQAKRSLMKCRASLTSGYDKSEELLRVAGTVFNLADDLYGEMEKQRGVKRKIITED